MKKVWCWMFLLICVIQLLMGCSNHTLDFGKIKDGNNYIWPTLEYGMTIEEAEKAIGGKVETVPYSSSYGERINTRYDGTEPAIDYRANTDYEYAEFFVTDMTVEYGGGKGYLCLLFKHGSLYGTRVLWGTHDSKRDSLLKFEKSKNDPDAIFEELCKEMIRRYGEPEKENEAAELHSLVWTLGDSSVVISRQYQSDSGDAVSMTISQVGEVQ